MDGARILIVDDDELARRYLRDLVTTLGYTPILAENGLAALAVVRNGPIDVVLLDLMMPEVDGVGVLKQLKEDSSLNEIPVIVVSALDDIGSMAQCIELGADDYLVKPFNQTLFRARVQACVEQKALLDEKRAYQLQVEDYNIRLGEKVREQVGAITAGHIATIFAMCKLAEARDPDTGQHLERVRRYCRFIAVELRDGQKFVGEIVGTYVEDIYAASPLHDIGKVAIPDHILLKPGPLTAQEFAVIQTHTQIGKQVLEQVSAECPDNSFVRLGVDIAGSHHEKWDGTGYPEGRVGREIPLSARIVAVADVYDSLVSKRCYKKALSHTESCAIIREGKGKAFDPLVVEAFLTREQVILAVRETIPDEPTRQDAPLIPEG